MITDYITRRVFTHMYTLYSLYTRAGNNLFRVILQTTRDTLRIPVRSLNFTWCKMIRAQSFPTAWSGVTTAIGRGDQFNSQPLQ